jgi:hypothetical protein
MNCDAHSFLTNFPGSVVFDMHARSPAFSLLMLLLRSGPERQTVRHKNGKEDATFHKTKDGICSQ